MNQCQRPYINWLQNFALYQTQTQIYVVASNAAESCFRVLKISRAPVPLIDSLDPAEATEANETPADRVWRLNIFEDPHTYSRSELAIFLSMVTTLNKNPGAAVSDGHAAQNKDKLYEEPPLLCRSPLVGGITSDRASVLFDSSTVPSGHIYPDCLPIAYPSLTGYGLVGFVRFFFGYYLIIITQRREVARIGEHRIYKVEDTRMVYVPGEPLQPLEKLVSKSPTQLGKSDAPASWWTSMSMSSSSKLSRIISEETRYLRLFQSIDLSGNFYYSHTYDLTNCLQENLAPYVALGAGASAAINTDVTSTSRIFKLIPHDRFVWNWNLIPPRFHGASKDRDSGASNSSDWLVNLIHGFLGQASIVACGMPIAITLIGRRSRFFAGTRFLKRGVNLTGDVANEVETEQIVCDFSTSCLCQTMASSFVQVRGSVPLFWTQDTTKLVVGKPPIEIYFNDPYYESFGLHFANLIERFGTPVIVLNLMKQKEKRRFEQQLTEGLRRGIDYLNLFTGTPVLFTIVSESSNQQDPIDFPPIMYLGFDVARVQKSPNLMVLNRLQPVAEACVQQTGIFFTPGSRLVSAKRGGNKIFTEKRAGVSFASALRPRQRGVIRVNCVDCLDRTNTGQYVIGHVVLGHQLTAFGLLSSAAELTFTSAISRILQELYEDHGDTLALQYGGSCLVHNIDTYQKTGKLRSQSRDLMQTLSRYYANNFSDFDKQLATDVFLRVFRPGAWVGNLPFNWSAFSQNEAAFSSGEDDPHITVNHQLLALVAASVAASSLIGVTGCGGASGSSTAKFQMDTAAEAHVHWLYAWARLPIERRSFTDWFPRCALSEMVTCTNEWELYPALLGEERYQTSEPISKNKYIFLEPSHLQAPSWNWFAEFYRPTSWTHFNDLTFCQLPVVSILIDNMSIRSLVQPRHVSLLSCVYRLPSIETLLPPLHSSQSLTDLEMLVKQQAPCFTKPLPILRSGIFYQTAVSNVPTEQGKTPMVAMTPPKRKSVIDKASFPSLINSATSGSDDGNSSDSFVGTYSHDLDFLSDCSSDAFLVSSPPTLLEYWGLSPGRFVTASKHASAAYRSLWNQNAQVVLEPGCASTRIHNPDSVKVCEALRRFENLRFSDLTNAASMTSQQTVSPILSSTNRTISVLSSHQNTTKIIIDHRRTSSSLERTYNLCSSYSDICLSPPSDSDMARYRRYAESRNGSTEFQTKRGDELINPATLKFYSDMVDFSKTGKYLIPYNSFITYVNHVVLKNQLRC